MIILVTGATGLAGSHAAIALLKAGHRVVAVGRGKEGASAERRVRRVLQSYPGYDRGEYTMAALSVFEGDLSREFAGLDGDVRGALCGEIDAVLHCAAEVSFDGGPRQAPLAINVEGVRQMARLAGALKARRFIHVSTAYVDRALENKPSRTEYEVSKLEGEQALLETADRHGFETVIVRPSIITGDRIYGFTPTYNGIYPFLRYASSFSRDFAGTRPSSWFPHPLFFEGRGNLVPADYLAAVLKCIVEMPSEAAKVYNVINPQDWKVWDIIEIIARQFGVPEEEVSDTGFREAELPERAKKMADALIETYEPYFDTGPSLETGTTESLVSSQGIAPLENSPEWIKNLLRWGVSRNWQEIG